MPKYWVKNYFAHGRFPEVGQKQKTEKKKRERERERERAKVSVNKGQYICVNQKKIMEAEFFVCFFLLFTDSVRSRPPGPPAVPGVFSIIFIGPGDLRAPCVLACAMRSLAIVITNFRSFLFFFSVFCF